MHTAQILAEFIDNDVDGIPDDMNVINSLTENNYVVPVWTEELRNKHFSSQSGTPCEENIGYASRMYFNVDTWALKGIIQDGIFDVNIEEVWHVVSRGWHDAYPEYFGIGYENISKLNKAMDIARGGKFKDIPSKYPEDAWYSYYEKSCGYSCQASEYFYWAVAANIGTLDPAYTRICERSKHEWYICTKLELKEKDPDIYQLLNDEEFNLPKNIPLGKYKHIQNSPVVAILKKFEFDFNTDLLKVYVPENAQVEWGALKGYLEGHAYSTPNAWGNPNIANYGVSFYTGIWSTFNDYLPADFQRGHGTWMTPDNQEIQSPLCRPGTTARDNWPERAPSYRDVFQTIEGGPGYWGNTQFPDPQMKYRVNIITDCYTTQSSSPGWNWGGTSTLNDQAGIAQISNTLLYAPDGITFKKGTNGAFLGQAWMNLPLTVGLKERTLVGKNNWTLFLNSGNFSGPTVYVTPEAWFRITEGYPPAQQRGLDSRLFSAERYWSLADEIGRINSLKVDVDYSGNILSRETSDALIREGKDITSYIRIPSMNYPVDRFGRTIYHQDLKTYSKSSIYEPIQSYIEEGFQLSSKKLDGQNGSFALKFEGADFGWKLHNKEIEGLENRLSVDTFEEGKAWGIKWLNNDNAGKFPQYFIEEDQSIKILDVYTNEFINTKLLDTKLAPNPLGINPYTGIDSYDPPNEGWPAPEGGKAYVAVLNDGSIITYGWYRFIDQPSIKKLNLSEEKRAQLQLVIEAIHAVNWGVDNPVLNPPTFGELALIDDALILTPPDGMEVGYVPIALAQNEYGCITSKTIPCLFEVKDNRFKKLE